MELKLGWLYPTLMSIYGDRGNVICLQRRLQWRDIEVSIIPFPVIDVLVRILPILVGRYFLLISVSQNNYLDSLFSE